MPTPRFRHFLVACGILVAASHAIADNPATDAADSLDGEVAITIDAPQDCTFGRIFVAQKSDRGRYYEITVSGKLHRFDLGKMPTRILLSFFDGDEALGFGEVKPTVDGSFAARSPLLFESPAAHDTHLIRMVLSLHGKQPMRESFRFSGILICRQ